MRILWAVSSVGKGHVMRDIAIAKHLHRLADVNIDWLVPEPAGSFMINKGFNVLQISKELQGSGNIYDKVFKNCDSEFNLIDYILADTRLHKSDFLISAKAWKNAHYDLIIGDEAFWLLTGFASRWKKKPAPFIFITDFIGVRAMKYRVKDKIVAWYNNLKFIFSHLGTDEYFYIGDYSEIPDKTFGFGLPKQREWAKKHTNNIAPIVNFDIKSIPHDKNVLRKRLGLPENRKLFLATVGPEGNFMNRIIFIESVFELLQKDYPQAFFIMVCHFHGNKRWIQYENFLDQLYEYFAASDFVITQSGYGKIIELSAIGTPFIAIPLDYHFEQEYVMNHRLKEYNTGKLVTLRNHTPEHINDLVHELMDKGVERIPCDDGTGAALKILQTVNGLL